MGNVLEKSKQEQVIALGRLGWSLRRIEQATGVRRETAGGYLRSVGIALRTPGGWGAQSSTKADHFGYRQLWRFKTGQRSDYRLFTGKDVAGAGCPAHGQQQ
jgi:hypothetical protein